MSSPIDPALFRLHSFRAEFLYPLREEVIETLPRNAGILDLSFEELSDSQQLVYALATEAGRWLELGEELGYFAIAPDPPNAPTLPSLRDSMSLVLKELDSAAIPAGLLLSDFGYTLDQARDELTPYRRELLRLVFFAAEQEWERKLGRVASILESRKRYASELPVPDEILVEELGWALDLPLLEEDEASFAPLKRGLGPSPHLPASWRSDRFHSLALQSALIRRRLAELAEIQQRIAEWLVPSLEGTDAPVPSAARREMRSSFAAARQAAAEVRTAEHGRQAIRTIRPRGVVGVVRSRAPLPILLYVAARDGLVVEQDGGGFAVLQPPLIKPPDRSGGYGLRSLRWLDRRWELVVFSMPAALGLLGSVATILFSAAALAGVVVLQLVTLYVAVWMAAMLVRLLGWPTQMGAATARRRGRADAALPGYHWSAPLVHQPDPNRVDELIKLMTDRLRRVVITRAQHTENTVRNLDVHVTETLVVLTTGISTDRTRAAMAESVRALRDYSDAGDMIMLAAPSRLESVPQRQSRRPSGRFFLLYVLGLVVVIAASARFVADAESAACAETSCAGQPTTYGLAMRWLLHRLLLSDPPDLSPLTTSVALLGWLISTAAIMLIPVAFVAGRQEIVRNRGLIGDYDYRLADIAQRSRTLILAVTSKELNAVAEAVHQRTSEPAITDQTGSQTAYVLGTLGTTEIVLAQVGSQGVATATGMLNTAFRLIPHFRPDYVILTGTCYGLRKDEGQRPGDIIICRRLQGVDHSDVAGDQAIRRGVSVGSSQFLLDRFQAAQATWTGAPVHIGTMLTSNAVLNSRDSIYKLREEFPDAIAGEMEGIGVYAATTENIKPDWIVVKAISDWGYAKNDVGSPLAARNAAEYLTHVIASGALSPRRSVHT